MLLAAWARPGLAHPGEANPEEEGWGTAHPLIVEAVSATGSWVVACQARSDTDGDGRVDVRAGQHGGPFGDAVTPYLLLGPGPGEALDAFVAAAPGGQHVAYLQHGRLWLRDVAKPGAEDLTALGADSRDHEDALLPHRALAFDREGTRAAWFRLTKDGASQIVIRTLGSGAEAVVDPGAGLPVFLRFEGAGDWLRIVVVPTRADGSTPTKLPRQATSLDPRRCRAQPMSYSVFGRAGACEMRYARATGGAASARPDVVGVVGSMLLRRRDDGALLRSGGPDDSETVVTAPEDRALLDAICLDPHAALVRDSQGAQAGRLRIVTEHDVIDVPLRGVATAPEEPRWSPRLWKVAGADGGVRHLLDLATARAYGFKDVVAQRDRVLLIVNHTHRELRIGDLDAAGQVIVLGDLTDEELEEAAHPHVARGMVATLGRIVDLERGVVLGTYEGSALAVSPTGQVLLPADRGERGVVRGPLRWIEAKR